MAGLATAIVVAAVGVIFGASAPASATTPECTTYLKVYFTEDDGTYVNYRIPMSSTTTNCILRQGDQNDGVRVLQYLVACNGHYTLPDGRVVTRDGQYGPITAEAVRLMQLDVHVTADGIWGPETLGAVPYLPVFKGEEWWFYDCY